MKGLTDITVDRGPIDNIFIPYDGVDALHQASKASPYHIQASARIPSCSARY